jgi:pumilio homology domain family member 6
MPTAITTKNTMPGRKRKSAPVKDVHIKDSKKLKIDSSLKSAMKSKSKAPINIVEESSEFGSEDSDSDGGAPLHSKSAVSLEDEEEEDEDSDSEATPKVADGLHPDRAKAVVTNSKSECLIFRTSY